MQIDIVTRKQIYEIPLLASGDDNLDFQKVGRKEYHELIYVYIYRAKLVRIFEETAIFILRGCKYFLYLCKSPAPYGSPLKICVSKFKGFGRRIASNAGAQRQELLARVHLHLSCTFRRLGPTTGESSSRYISATVVCCGLVRKPDGKQFFEAFRGVRA